MKTGRCQGVIEVKVIEGKPRTGTNAGNIAKAYPSQGSRFSSTMGG